LQKFATISGSLRPVMFYDVCSRSAPQVQRQCFPEDMIAAAPQADGNAGLLV